MTVQDLLAVEGLGDVRVSPNGTAVALVVQRRRSAAEIYQRNLLLGNDRADVWVASTRGNDLRKIIGGNRSPAASWNPVWSPDGGRLALLSNRGDGKVRLYLWNEGTIEPHRLADDGIDLHVTFVMDGRSLGPVAWLDADRLLCVLRPPNDEFDGDYVMKRTVMREWPKAEQGREPTASVLDTYQGALPQQEVLAIVDATTRRIDTVAVTQPFALSPEPNQPRILNVSPDRGVAVWITQSGEVRRRADVPVRFGDATGPLRLGILPLRRNATIRWSDRVEPTFGDLDPQPWSGWSPDSRRFAVLGTGVGQYGPSAAFVVEVTTGKATQVSPAGWQLTTLHWAGNRAVVVRRSGGVHGEGPSLSSPGRQRADWWRLDLGPSEAAPVNLTAVLPSPPLTLVPVRTTDFVALAASSLWRVSALTGRVSRLTDPTEAALVGVGADLVQGATAANRPPTLVATAERHGIRQSLRVDVGSTTARLTSIPLPIPEAELLAYLVEQQLAVFTSGMADVGPVVWAGRTNSEEFKPLVTLNDHLRAVRRAKQRWIDYASTDGDSLRAALLLPIDYQQGRRYPLVTWVYGGFVWGEPGDGFSEFFRVTSGNTYNLQLLTARGYAVLLPSMPLGAMGPGVGSDPYVAISHGVMPAVEKVVELGIADGERLGVMGHSYGGYSTYALVTQTDRFKAAIAMAGPTNLVSWYGTLNPWRRYSDTPHQYYYAPLLLESGMGRMGAMPYGDLNRYVLNSPLFHVERLRTPLLIVHGDLDAVAIQQAEEMFTALHRLGKPARFVRYWGEGHSISSPANIRDMWQRIFWWFDEHLKGDKPAATTSSSSTPPGPTRITAPPTGRP